MDLGVGRRWRADRGGVAGVAGEHRGALDGDLDPPNTVNRSKADIGSARLNSSWEGAAGLIPAVCAALRQLRR